MIRLITVDICAVGNHDIVDMRAMRMLYLLAEFCKGIVNKLAVMHSR